MRSTIPEVVAISGCFHGCAGGRMAADTGARHEVGKNMTILLVSFSVMRECGAIPRLCAYGRTLNQICIWPCRSMSGIEIGKLMVSILSTSGIPVIWKVRVRKLRVFASGGFLCQVGNVPCHKVIEWLIPNLLAR